MTTILFCIGTVVLLFRHKKQDILLIVLPLTMYMVLGKMNYKAMRHVLPMVPFLHIIAAKVLELFGNLLQGIKFKKLVVVLLVAVVIIPQGIKSFRYDTALLQTDTRTLLKTWIEKNLPAYTSIGTEEFGPSLLSEWDLNLNLIKRSPHYKNIYKVYGLVPGMFAHGGRFCKSHSPINFIMKNNIQYIILDSFTRARYTWPISREKNPDAVRSRKLFYLWVKEHGELVKIIKPENDFNISPALEVYRLNIRYTFTGGYSVNFNGQ
jgi:hypothetical protein